MAIVDIQLGIYRPQSFTLEFHSGVSYCSRYFKQCILCLKKHEYFCQHCQKMVPIGHGGPCECINHILLDTHHGNCSLVSATAGNHLLFQEIMLLGTLTALLEAELALAGFMIAETFSAIDRISCWARSFMCLVCSWTQSYQNHFLLKVKKSVW